MILRRRKIYKLCKPFYDCSNDSGGKPNENQSIRRAGRTRHLYERLGFVHLGTIPKDFLMKDGSYQNICIYYHQL